MKHSIHIVSLFVNISYEEKELYLLIPEYRKEEYFPCFSPLLTNPFPLPLPMPILIIYIMLMNLRTSIFMKGTLRPGTGVWVYA